MELEKTVERIVPKDFKSREEYLLYLRHLFAYEEALKFLDKGLQVLEIGFGEGYGANLMAQHLGSVTALDVNKQAVEYANQKYSNDNCTFIHYNGHELPFGEDKFDAVISFQVIEHIEDDENYLKEIHRVLKKGEKAILTTPNRETRLNPGEEPWNEFHVREYNSEQLNEVLSEFFPSVEIQGIRAEKEIEKIERNRVKRKLSFYKLLPDALKRMVTGDFINRYNTGLFYLDSQNVNLSMDLYAFAQK
jgi:ubiquinone/menaquinone biosynthesis C-methylase UbiE